jgi:hypothetical protein
MFLAEIIKNVASRTNKKALKHAWLCDFKANNYFMSDNVHYVKCANTYTKKSESACNDIITMIQYCQIVFQCGILWKTEREVKHIDDSSKEASGSEVDRRAKAETGSTHGLTGSVSNAMYCYPC